MLENFKHLRYLGKLKPIRNSNNKFFNLSLKILVFSIIPLSLLITGCGHEDENKVMVIQLVHCQ
jgi:hypothetical protein